MKTEIKNLEQLMRSLRADAIAAFQAAHAGHHFFSCFDWTDLPTFGGDEPARGTSMVWSWDATRLLVGTCADDLKIVPRDELEPVPYVTPAEEGQS